ncbi:MAG TPA: hypothetical protein VNQ81_04390 [Povalibacter sp.]|nr:hypothetical protein [Povalibacter sp.]
MANTTRRGPRSFYKRLLVPGASVAILAATWVGAVDDVGFEVERIDGAGWSAENIAIRLDLPANATRASATIARIRLAAQEQELRDVRIECPSVEISAATIACRDARIAGNLPSLGVQRLTGRVVFGRHSGALDIELGGLRLGEGLAKVKAGMSQSGWHARLDMDRAQLEPLLKLAHALKLPLPQLTASGETSLSLTAAGSQTSLGEAHIAAKFVDLTANNEEGSLATDKLSFSLRADVRQSGGDWLFQAEVQSNSGQAYAQPVFLDLGAHALNLSASGKWGSDGVLGVEQFSIDHRDVARGQGSATLRFDDEQPLRALSLDLQSLEFPGAYESYFQPLLLDTNFKSLQTAGEISGQVRVEDGVPRKIDLKLAGVTLDDGNRNLVLKELTGDWHWLEAQPARSTASDDDDELEQSRAADSLLRWSGGTLLNLDLGPSELQFNTQGRQLRLLQPARLPILDGALELESFRIRNAGLPSVAFIVDATIQPISVQQLCRAFGWPEFGGRIGGKISKLRMREKVVTLGTTLQAQVFDGEVKISDLRLEQPFSQWPRFYSNIALDNLDLELVTGAFSFGRITGRLSGAVNGLQLFNWTPVAFDARLFTPPGDRSRHRISQRAVQNIGSIGGGGAGVTAALSSGVMRFFDDFNYDRLGLSCRLENEVCYIDGVAPAPNGGYYLVKGKGLPRIDVIGGAHRVDWPRLVQQLIALTQSEGPVVR